MYTAFRPGTSSYRPTEFVTLSVTIWITEISCTPDEREWPKLFTYLRGVAVRHHPGDLQRKSWNHPANIPQRSLKEMRLIIILKTEFHVSEPKTFPTKCY